MTGSLRRLVRKERQKEQILFTTKNQKRPSILARPFYYNPETSPRELTFLLSYIEFGQLPFFGVHLQNLYKMANQ